MHSKFWADEVVRQVKAADWMRVLAAIASAEERQLDLLETYLAEQDLLRRLNDHLPKAIRKRRAALQGRLSAAASMLKL